MIALAFAWALIHADETPAGRGVALPERGGRHGWWGRFAVHVRGAGAAVNGGIEKVAAQPGCRGNGRFTGSMPPHNNPAAGAQQ